MTWSSACLLSGTTQRMLQGLSKCFKYLVNASRTQRMLGAFFFPFFIYSFIELGVEFADRHVDTVVSAVTGEYTEECRE